MNAQRIRCTNGRRRAASKSSRCSGSMPIATARGATIFAASLSLPIVVAFAAVIGSIVTPPAGWFSRADVGRHRVSNALASGFLTRNPLPPGRDRPDRQIHRREVDHAAVRRSADDGCRAWNRRSSVRRPPPPGPASVATTSLPRPAKPRQAMPGPDPPRHAKPRREIFNRRTPPSSSIPQLGHLLDVEPPVEAALLRPPVAEPDAAAARGQPRRQLVAVHQLRVDIGDADD